MGHSHWGQIFLRPGYGGILPFRDSFDRDNGALGGRWQGGANWAIVGNEAINTPTPGFEIVVNGTFGADANWNKGINWTIAAGVLTATNVAQFVSTTQAGVFTLGTWYLISIVMSGWIVGGIYVQDAAGTAFLLTGGNGTGLGTYRSSATGAIYLKSQAANNTFNLDDCSVKALTLSDLITGILAGVADVTVTVELDTIVANTEAGVLVSADSLTAPANFVLGVHNGANAKLIKCVAGTYTELISTAAAYGAGRYIQVVKSGTSYSLYYNGVQIGATQTIADAGIVNNTRHGMFSTYNGNQLDNFSIVRT